MCGRFVRSSPVSKVAEMFNARGGFNMISNVLLHRMLLRPAHTGEKHSAMNKQHTVAFMSATL